MNNKKTILIFEILLVFIVFSIFVLADGWTNQPSHETLYVDILTSKGQGDDGDPVTIADDVGLYVTTNVGIGTANPGDPLDIKGLRFDVLSGQGEIHMTYDSQRLYLGGGNGRGPTNGAVLRLDGTDIGGANAGGDAVLQAGADAGEVYLRIGSADKLTIDHSGNVGIGTTSPSYNLEVYDTAAANVELSLAADDINHTYTNAADTNTFGLFDSGAGTSGGLLIQGFSDADVTGLELIGFVGSTDPTDAVPAIILDGRKNKTGAGADPMGDDETVLSIQNKDTPLVTVLGSGNVGIGNTTPNDKLRVNGNITSDNVFLPQYIFSHTNETIPVLGASVWTNVTFSQENADLKQGITHDMITLNHTFTITQDGVYYFHYDYDLIDTSGASSDIDVAGRAIYVNGTEVIGSAHEVGIQKKGVETDLTYPFFANLHANDVIIFQFIATDADVKISTHGTFGEHPESAAIIIDKRANLP